MKAEAHEILWRVSSYTEDVFELVAVAECDAEGERG